MKDSLLIKCLAVSAALHAVAIPLLVMHPLHFYPNFTAVLGKTAPTPIENTLSAAEKEAFLEEAMKHFVVVSPQMPPPLDTARAIGLENLLNTAEEKSNFSHSELALPSSREIALPEVLPTHPLNLPENQLQPHLLDHSFAIENSRSIIASVPSPMENPFASIEAEPIQLSAIPLDESLDFEFLPTEEATQQITPAASPSLPTSTTVIAADTMILSKKQFLPDESPALKQTPKSARNLSLQQAETTPLPFTSPSLESYGIPALTLMEWNDIFAVDIKTFAQEDGSYLFSLAFVPKFDLAEYRMKQNYYFLIDRSNSIEKHRFQSFKRAVLRSIGVLREGDSFNIVLFDSKITRLSEIPLPFNHKNYQAAEEFLNKQNATHYGTATEIYAALPKIVPSQVNPNEAHTAILITDGNSHIKADKQRSLINQWLEANQGRVTLYTAAVGQGNNLPMLDLLGTAGRGSLLYSDTHTGFPRKLAKLVLSLRTPVAQEMSFSVLSVDSSSRLKLYPTPSRLPFLFYDRPYVMFGVAEKLSDFSILLQGKNKDQLLSIKKNISFSDAKPGTRALIKQWPVFQAHLLYEQYLLEGKTALFEEAKKLLPDDAAYSRR